MNRHPSITVYFVTHETGAYSVPSTLKKIKVRGIPPSVASLERKLKESRYATYMKHGYKLQVHDTPNWDYTSSRERSLTNADLRDGQIVYVVCRRPRQHSKGFTMV